MNSPTHNKASITAVSGFVEKQSDSKSNRYVFAYTITIENISDHPFQLVSRHWVIQDANRKVEEVYGEGVVGEQPVIKPGQSYTYSSGAVLETEMGTMEGRYFMLSDSDAYSRARLPPIPDESCHPFHGKVATHSSECCHPAGGEIRA